MLVFAVSGTNVHKWYVFLFPHGASLPHAVPCFSGKGDFIRRFFYGAARVEKSRGLWYNRIQRQI